MLFQVFYLLTFVTHNATTENNEILTINCCSNLHKF